MTKARLPPHKAYPIPTDAPFQVGDKVIAYGTTRWGKPRVEGRGVVIGGGQRRDVYLLRPDSGGFPVYRWIKPGISQTAPIRFLAMKEAEYRLRQRKLLMEE